MADSIRVGSFTSTGAAKTVELGWIPKYVRVVNKTTGTRIDEWFTGMANDTSIAIVTTAGPVLNAADGVTPYTGSSSMAAGFICGTDLIGSTGNEILYIAARET